MREVKVRVDIVAVEIYTDMLNRSLIHTMSSVDNSVFWV